jgi:hypothetical protein
LTGHPLEDELKDLRTQGLGGWLLKPPSLERLAEVMAQALKDRSIHCRQSKRHYESEQGQRY